MAVEYDLVPGFDLTSLTSATQAQVMQAISQAEPESNKGLVIVGDTAPDVANNPRFARYLWIDTSGATEVPKVYDGANWNATTVAATSVTSAMLTATALSLFNGATPRIGNDIAHAGVVGDQYKLLRLDANGKYVETISLATLLASETVPLEALKQDGAAINHFMVNTGTRWDNVAFSPATHIGDLGIPITKVAVSGTALQVLRTNAAKTAAEWVDPATTIANDTITLAMLKQTAEGSAYQVLRKSAANVPEWWTPPATKQQADLTLLNPLTTATAATSVRAAHGMAIVPKFVFPYLECLTDEFGYIAGDRVLVQGVTQGSGNESITFSCDPTYVWATWPSSLASYDIHDKTGGPGTGGVIGTVRSITLANWALKCNVMA